MPNKNQKTSGLFAGKLTVLSEIGGSLSPENVPVSCQIGGSLSPVIWSYGCPSFKVCMFVTEELLCLFSCSLFFLQFFVICISLCQFIFGHGSSRYMILQFLNLCLLIDVVDRIAFCIYVDYFLVLFSVICKCCYKLIYFKSSLWSSIASLFIFSSVVSSGLKKSLLSTVKLPVQLHKWSFDEQRVLVEFVLCSQMWKKKISSYCHFTKYKVNKADLRKLWKRKLEDYAFPPLPQSPILKHLAPFCDDEPDFRPVLGHLSPSERKQDSLDKELELVKLQKEKLALELEVLRLSQGLGPATPPTTSATPCATGKSDAGSKKRNID